MEKSVGRFEIRRELGRGAQSVVYLAWDPQLEREVAIKTLHFARTDAKRNAALLDEARAELERALELRPDFPKAREALDSLSQGTK